MRVAVGMRLFVGLLLLGPGCKDAKDTDPSVDTDTDDTQEDTAVEDTADTDVPEPPDPCLTPPSLPRDFTTLTGFSTAEDFDFDGDGYHVSINEQGHLFGENQAGDTKLISPGVADSPAGTRILPDGSWVICNVGAGSLVRVDAVSGAKQTLISGLAYPNGLEVDLDGFVYVAEQNAGRVRRVDPATGNYENIATGLDNPNGLAFSPDYNTLYVGSFGAGTVTAIARKPNKTEWEAPREHAYVGDAVAQVIDPCVGQVAGEQCYRLRGGVGFCDDAAGPLECVAAPDVSACLGKQEGDSCTTDAFGQSYPSKCVDPGGVQDLYCPLVELDALEACEGESLGDSCEAGGESGTCSIGFDGVPVCLTGVDQELMVAACDSIANGEACTASIASGLYKSWCMDLSGWGISDRGCKLPAWKANPAGGDGLDGINADECNNVYVTEFVTGYVYRIRPSGVVHLAASLPSYWIPNMRWGNDVGGWDSNRLYVSDREQGRLFAIDVGHAAKESAFKPGGSNP
jgi:sugar lactone lactonase YvrE